MNKKEQLKRLICALYRQDEPEDYTDECMEDMLASVDKGIHNKTTKYGLPTY